MDFATTNTKFGWEIVGIYPGVDFTDVNSVERSHNKTLIATGDDFGRVNIFKYPCIDEDA